MGRGKQKAKQAKVARELKYQNVPTDFAALKRELDASTPTAHGGLSDRDTDPFDDDPRAS